MYIYIYKYIYIFPSLAVYIYVYKCVYIHTSIENIFICIKHCLELYICASVYTYIYIYICVCPGFWVSDLSCCGLDGLRFGMPCLFARFCSCLRPAPSAAR